MRPTCMDVRNVAHEESCKGTVDSFKLVDILSIPTNGEVPKQMEKAAYHVVTHKMVPNKGIEFSTGGSRVSAIELKIILTHSVC